MRLQNAKKQQKKQETRVARKRKKVKDLTVAASNIQNALNGEKTRVVDQADLDILPPAVT